MHRGRTYTCELRARIYEAIVWGIPPSQSNVAPSLGDPDMTFPKWSRIILMWLALVFIFTLSALSQTVSLQHNSNLRKSASTSSAIIDLLPAGAQVTLISNKRRSGYYHVRAAAGAIGWVLARLLPYSVRIAVVRM